MTLLALPSFKLECVSLLFVLFFVFLSTKSLHAKSIKKGLGLVVASILCSLASIAALAINNHLNVMSLAIVVFLLLMWLMLLVIVKNDYPEPSKAFTMAAFSCILCMTLSLSLVVYVSEVEVTKDPEHGVVYITKIDPLEERTYGLAVVARIDPPMISYDC